MANRPIFLPDTENAGFQEKLVEFKWHPGMAASQKKKSVAELHSAAIAAGICSKPLEASSKSELPLGQQLSAFNLQVQLKRGQSVALENVFQAAKVFKHGGPFRDLLNVSPKDAKRDPRLQSSGELIAFRSAGMDWPLEPKSLYYDWIYLKALEATPSLTEALMAFDGFTDIEFNPSKSINCQARSVALFVALEKRGITKELLGDAEAFKEHMTQLKGMGAWNQNAVQPKML